jgi:hypothetical protein
MGAGWPVAIQRNAKAPASRLYAANPKAMRSAIVPKAAMNEDSRMILARKGEQEESLPNVAILDQS